MPFLRSLLRCACLPLAAFSLGGQPEVADRFLPSFPGAEGHGAKMDLADIEPLESALSGKL